MTRAEAVNWIINISADIGKVQHQELWHYEQALAETKELLEMPSAESEIIRCKDCRHWSHRNGGHCDVWDWYISNDAFYCGCGERKTDG